MKKEKLLELLQGTSHHMLAWETHQPEELRAIEKLIIDLSKAVYHYEESSSMRAYIDEACDEIKQLAHSYQRKAGHKK